MKDYERVKMLQEMNSQVNMEERMDVSRAAKYYTAAGQSIWNQTLSRRVEA